MSVLQRLRAGRHATDPSLAALCLKHFAAVYVHALEGEPRARLVALQKEKLRALSVELARADADSDRAATEAAVGRAVHAWRTVL